MLHYVQHVSGYCSYPITLLNTSAASAVSPITFNKSAANLASPITFTSAATAAIQLHYYTNPITLNVSAAKKTSPILSSRQRPKQIALLLFSTRQRTMQLSHYTITLAPLCSTRQWPMLLANATSRITFNASTATATSPITFNTSAAIPLQCSYPITLSRVVFLSHSTTCTLNHN